MDIKGAELSALRGMVELLSNQRPTSQLAFIVSPRTSGLFRYSSYAALTNQSSTSANMATMGSIQFFMLCCEVAISLDRAQRPLNGELK